MIHGCAGNGLELPSLELAPAEAIDQTAVKCPEVDKATRDTFKQRIAKPADWSRVGAKAKDMQAHSDRQALLIERMGKTGDRVVGELDACRGTPPPKTS